MNVIKESLKLADEIESLKEDIAKAQGVRSQLLKELREAGPKAEKEGWKLVKMLKKELTAKQKALQVDLERYHKKWGDEE